MKRKLLLTVLMAAFVMCIFAISAFAAECIDGIYYTFNGTEATVSTDNQKNCLLETVAIPEKVTAKDGTEYTVTAIASKAFGSQNKGGGNAKVKNVTVPSTVTSVGEYAFGNCPNIVTVNCKSTKIGSRMFIDCNILESITLENTVEIGGNAFNRTIITSVTIPSTVTTVGDYAFKECKSLTKVVVLGSIMGSNMFYGCSALNTLVLTERFITFGSSALGSAPANGTFITYYTGSDYERVKALGSSTSRFKEAKCYSYSDYIENNYTDRYKVIYNCNLCVVAFGNHTEPADDGNCTTAVVCSVCDAYTFKQAMEHATNERITYTSLMEKGKYYLGCTNDGCSVGRTEEKSELFLCLGYSAPEYGVGEIAVGYMANDEAIEFYETVSGTTVEFGLFAVSKTKLGDNEIFGASGASDGVISYKTSDSGFSVFELRLFGFENGQKDAKIAMGTYVTISGNDGTEYIYLQESAPASGEKYHFVSYNEIVNKI